MALRVRSITPGRIVKGRFIPNPEGKMKLGKGGRFEKCLEEVTARGGALDPQAVCASRGIRKYGKKRMLGWARKARTSRNPRYYVYDGSTALAAFGKAAAARRYARTAAKKHGRTMTIYSTGGYTDRHMPKGREVISANPRRKNRRRN